MERTIYALIASAWLAACAPALAGQVPGAASDPDIPISHRDRVYSAEQFSNTVSVTDPCRQQAARRYSARRSAAGQSQSALPRPVAGARHGIFARSSNHRGGRDRLECRELHRYRDQLGQARHLRRALATRSVLHA